LRRGVSEWNAWRETNREVQPDLSGAILTNGTFTRADFSGSDLSGAILSRASLVEANLSGANLTQADLSGADMTAANLDRATLGWTILVDIDLSQVKGIESIHHRGPSVLSFDTLYRSWGTLPIAFLRGVGTPESLMQYVGSLDIRPIDFHTCFISYSSKDQRFVQRLYADMQSNGIRCWFAPENLAFGAKTRVSIDEAIRLHDKLLLVLSRHSVRSDWVEKEVETAMERERKEKRLVLVPVRLDNAVMQEPSGWAADIRRARHIGDFRGWRNEDAYARALARLIRELTIGR
jgi:uncharacterized protein YjbI with pentapeptide repeats